MAIQYTCRCGANIRMPNNVAGRKARCNSCGFIFVVPSLDLNPPSPPARGREPDPRPPKPAPPPPASAHPRVQSPHEEPAETETGGWLAAFARAGSEGPAIPSASPDTPPVPIPQSTATAEPVHAPQRVPAPDPVDGAPSIAESQTTLSPAPTKPETQAKPASAQDGDDDEEWYPSSGHRPKTIEFLDDQAEARRIEALSGLLDDAPVESAFDIPAPQPTGEFKEAAEATDPTSSTDTNVDEDDDGEWYPSSGRRPKLIDFLDGAVEEEPPATVLPERPHDIDMHATDAERSGILEASRPYWLDLITSFVFFLDAGSFVTFLIIILINVWTVPLTFAGPVGAMGLGILSGYLCTFYMTVILETASGEDELPNVWIGNVFDDLVVAGFRFIATVAWVLLPASCLAIIEFVNLGYVHWNAVLALAGFGLLFWPVVILGVSVGGGFYGLWPVTIIRTALCAPLAYLAMCAVLLIAAGIAALPHMPVYHQALAKLSGQTNKSLFWLIIFVNSTISAYAMIVAMRAIGLYYRHYKRRFPWVAE